MLTHGDVLHQQFVEVAKGDIHSHHRHNGVGRRVGRTSEQNNSQYIEDELSWASLVALESVVQEKFFDTIS